MSIDQQRMVALLSTSEGIRAVVQTNLLSDLTRETRPDMTHSGASEDLQRAWVATVMAYREVRGAIAEGHCLAVNLVAKAMLPSVLGEDPALCAGFAFFGTGPGAADNCDFGRRYRLEKWRDLYQYESEAEPAEHDFHVWLETATHIVDFTTFQIAPMMRASNEAFLVKGREGMWPPLICWAKRDLPKHPREAWGDRKLLLWRKPQALAHVDLHERLSAAQPVIERAVEIHEALKRGERVNPATSDLERVVAGDVLGR
jgi:hypothetical protein